MTEDQAAGSAGGLGRRGFLTALGVGAGAGVALGAGVAAAVDGGSSPGTQDEGGTLPFWGTHQQGVTNAPQEQTYFAVFDLTTTKRSDVADLLRTWTEQAAALTAGDPAVGTAQSPTAPPVDTGEAVDLGPSRLTLTFGFGATLFSKDGADRYGLAAHRPAALVDLPVFHGDQLNPDTTGGDLTVQACASDPQVAFHAVRQLARAATGVAQIRWVQAGFNQAARTKGTVRNLMGFKDGTANPPTNSASQMNQYVWAGSEGPSWMVGGSYLVARLIRISLEHWDTMPLQTQEAVIGRHKASGAPLGGTRENDPMDFTARNGDGTPTIPLDSHIRLSAAALNGGSQILRRSYSYNNGVSPFVERWPPWKQALEYDAGLLFCAYQNDPRSGFVRIFNQLALSDALNQFTTHTGSILVAIPPAASGPGHWIGEQLFA
ncbi:Dyp-type peroxidase [Kitasatospora sp. NPDC052896]|uniref:Dyp-type peroxidase n=1 Tax=Kitasatospora sp. NPDC052896 TaxID=3364061 RepID=UPI0037C5836E